MDSVLELLTKFAQAHYAVRIQRVSVFHVQDAVYERVVQEARKKRIHLEPIAIESGKYLGVGVAGFQVILRGDLSGPRNLAIACNIDGLPLGTLEL